MTILNLYKNQRIEAASREVATACSLAWQTGLMRGFSGNASLRLAEDRFLITATGVPKGRLGQGDFIVVDHDGNVVSGRRKPSIELGLHLALYTAFPECNAILHTHPVYLQAIARLVKNESALDIGLAESDYWRERFVHAPEHPPGSTLLGPAVVKALASRFHGSLLMPCAVWLGGHGLCSLAESIDSALGISEQLEQLAHIQWALRVGA